jgi:hypothetical protein
LYVFIGRHIEADVDAAARVNDGARVPFDRRMVQHVELGDVRRTSLVSDLAGDQLQGRLRASGQMHLGALAGVRAGDGGSDRAGASVDDGGLVLEQHSGRTTPNDKRQIPRCS